MATHSVLSSQAAKCSIVHKRASAKATCATPPLPGMGETDRCASSAFTTGSQLIGVATNETQSESNSSKCIAV